MTSQIGYLKLLITRSILSGPLDFEVKRVTCINTKKQWKNQYLKHYVICGEWYQRDPGKFMANLLSERKRKKCVCLCVEFNTAFNNFFSHIMTVYGCSRELCAYFN